MLRTSKGQVHVQCTSKSIARQMNLPTLLIQQDKGSFVPYCNKHPEETVTKPDLNLFDCLTGQVYKI